MLISCKLIVVRKTMKNIQEICVFMSQCKLFRAGTWFFLNYISASANSKKLCEVQGCTRFGFVCANSCAPHIVIAVETFKLARCKTAKIHRNEHIPVVLIKNACLFKRQLSKSTNSFVVSYCRNSLYSSNLLVHFHWNVVYSQRDQMDEPSAGKTTETRVFLYHFQDN